MVRFADYFLIERIEQLFHAFVNLFLTEILPGNTKTNQQRGGDFNGMEPFTKSHNDGNGTRRTHESGSEATPSATERVR